MCRGPAPGGYFVPCCLSLVGVPPPVEDSGLLPRDAWYAGDVGFNWFARLFCAARYAWLFGFNVTERWSFALRLLPLLAMMLSLCP